MKTISIIAIAVMALCCAAIADEAEPSCSGPINVEPGEWIILNGTSEPEDPDILLEDILYSWTFKNDTGYAFEVYDEDGDPISTIVDTSFFNFSAPLVPGCYKANLTVSYNKTVGALELEEACVDYDCIEICVQTVPCEYCSDIFCEYDCAEFPTDLTRCSAWNSTAGALCYDGIEGSAEIKWYVLDNETYNENDPWTETNVSTYLSSFTPDGAEYCFDPDWCLEAYPDGVYHILMTVWGPGTDEEMDTVYQVCDLGTIVEVEEPIAAIRRE